MFLAIGIAVAIGVIAGVVTVLDGRLRIADDLPVALLVGISGAVAGWALVDPIIGLSDGAGDPSAVLGSLFGSSLLIVLAWRGRRRVIGEPAPSPNSDWPPT